MDKLQHIETIGHEQISFGYLPLADRGTDEAKFYDRAIERTGKVESARLGFERAGKLTADGIKDKMAIIFAEAVTETEADLRNIEQQATAADERISKLALSGVQSLEPGDVASVQIDLALAQHFRAMDTTEKTGLFLAISNGEHSRMAQALLRIPDILTGINPSRKSALQDALIPADKLQQLSYVKAHAQRLQVAKQALLASQVAMRKHAQLSHAQARDALGLQSPTAALLAAKGLQPIAGG